MASPDTPLLDQMEDSLTPERKMELLAQEYLATYQKTKQYPEEVEREMETLALTPAYKALSYVQMNLPFLTAHKLMALEHDAYTARLRYVDLVPVPNDKSPDYFLEGQAFDDLVTLGQDYYADRYLAVSVRNKGAYEKNPGKVLLTETMERTVRHAAEEFRSREFFQQKLNKKVIFCIAYGMILKAELDSWDPETNRSVELKTCANLNTFIDEFQAGKGFFERYAFQQATYGFIHEMRTGQRMEAADLCVIDKFGPYSRSHKWTLTYEGVLKPRFEKIHQLLQEWEACHSSGIWPLKCDLDTAEGIQKFNDLAYYPLLSDFKKQIAATVL